MNILYFRFANWSRVHSISLWNVTGQRLNHFCKSMF